MSDERLTRSDFDDQEDWLRYCHEGGLLPWDTEADTPGGYVPAIGDSVWAQRARAVFGHTVEEHDQAFYGYPVSTHLGWKEFLRGFRGVALANCRGRTLDLHVTIAWSTVGIKEDEAVSSNMRQILWLLGAWCIERGFWPSYLWVLERGQTRGVHTHMLLGAPVKWRKALAEWLHLALAQVVHPKILLVGPMSSTMMITGLPKPGHVTQWGIFRYIYKGLEPGLFWQVGNGSSDIALLELAAKLKLKPEGVIFVNRMGLSTDLDALAVKWWQNRAHLPEMHPIKMLGGSICDYRFLNYYSENSWAMQSWEAEYRAHVALQAD